MTATEANVDQSTEGVATFLPMDPGDWGYLEFSRPARANAVDLASLHALQAALDSVPHSTRLIVLRGAGTKAFVSGGDIAAMRDYPVDQAAEFARTGQQFTRNLEAHPAVIGASVNGYALGGGTEIALACDVVTATASAVFGLPEVRLGILPGWGGTQRLVRSTGLQRGLRYLLSGQRFDGEEARRLGFVSACVSDADAAHAWWSEYAREVRAASPGAVAGAKLAARSGIDASIDQSLSIELGEWLRQFSGPDRTEGMTAFLDKRPPGWTHIGA